MTAQSSHPDVIGRIVEIIRRDLMLGPETEINPDTPLFGGEFDLDSLDALLLMQSLEKTFGFKVPTEAFGPEVFKTVESLAVFVQGLKGQTEQPGS